MRTAIWIIATCAMSYTADNTSLKQSTFGVGFLAVVWLFSLIMCVLRDIQEFNCE